jgi:hypothetical protein
MPSCGNHADERADNSDDDVANDAEARPLYELAGEPPRSEADEQYDDKTFIGNGHDISLLTSCTRRLGLTVVPARADLRKTNRASGHNLTRHLTKSGHVRHGFRKGE